MNKTLQSSSFWQTFQWIKDPIKFMEENFQKYGDVFSASLSSNIIFVNHPQGVQELLIMDPKNSTSVSSNHLLEPLLGSNSLLLLNGDRHQRQRQLLLPPFHGERVMGYAQLIKEIADRAIAQLTPGSVITMRKLSQEITLQVILNTVFGIASGERYEKISELLAFALDLLGTPMKMTLLYFPWLQKDLGSWSPWGKFVRKRREIDDLLMAEIQERRANFDPERGDILNLLLTAKDAEGEGMSDVEIKDELLTLLFAGHETTATAIAWAVYWLYSKPDVLAKVKEEIATLGDNPDLLALQKLPYLQAFCAETLRIYPVLMLTMPRRNEQPVSIMGQEQPIGSNLMGCIYLVHRREDIYPQADQFRPERFLERKYSAYEFFPFGGGNRRCIGDALAMLEMKISLASILKYDWELAEPEPVKPQRRGLTLSPKTGVRIKFLGQTKTGEARSDKQTVGIV
jgi:unspecific monooxygenase